MKLKSILLAIIFFFCLYVFGPMIFVSLGKVFNSPSYYFDYAIPIGWTLIIVGLLFIGYLSLIFKKFGNGTPVPIESTKKVIIKGPYRYTRNPMYLAHVVIWLGEFLVFGYFSLLIWLFAGWLGLHLFVILWEEPDLIKRLGNEYKDYLKIVPRWL